MCSEKYDVMYVSLTYFIPSPFASNDSNNIYAQHIHVMIAMSFSISTRLYHVNNFHLETRGSSVIVSNAGLRDLHADILYLYSGTGNPSPPTSIPGKLPTVAAVSSNSGEIRTFPAVIRLVADLAAIKNTATSAAVTTEVTRFIGNMTYKFPNSKSSSAVRGENLRPVVNELELTRKKVGQSSISSAAFTGSRN